VVCRGYWRNFLKQAEKTRHFTKANLRKRKAPIIDLRLQDQTACITEENVTTVNEMLDPVSQKDQKQTYLSTHQIPKEMVLTQRSIVQIIHCVLFIYQCDFYPLLVFCIYILQDNVATQLRCGGIFNNHFIANCRKSAIVKIFFENWLIFCEDIEISKGEVFKDSVVSQAIFTFIIQYYLLNASKLTFKYLLITAIFDAFVWRDFPYPAAQSWGRVIHFDSACRRFPYIFLHDKRKTPYTRKNLADISYTDRVIAHFVPNFVAMATGVDGGKMRLIAFKELLNFFHKRHCNFLIFANKYAKY